MDSNIKYESVGKEVEINEIRQQTPIDIVSQQQAEKQRLDDELEQKKNQEIKHTQDRINKRKIDKREVVEVHDTSNEAISINVENDSKVTQSISYKSIRPYLVQTKSANKVIIEKPKSPALAFIISLGRRAFTFLPLLVSLLNTLTKVYSLSAKLSSKTPGKPTYEYLDGMVFKTCSYYNFFNGACSSTTGVNSIGLFCDADGSTIESVTLQCSYTNNAAFKGFIIVWCALFGIYILYMILVTCRYSTWDLRYYIAEQHYKMGVTTSLWKYSVILLTLASGGYSFYSVKSQNQSYAATTNDAELILSTILFMIFNFAGINSYCKINPSLLGLVDHPMSKFPEEIHISYVKEPTITNLFGVMTNGNDIFSILEKGIAKSFVESDREIITQFGDADKIIESFKTMEIL